MDKIGLQKVTKWEITLEQKCIFRITLPAKSRHYNTTSLKIS